MRDVEPIVSGYFSQKEVLKLLLSYCKLIVSMKILKKNLKETGLFQKRILYPQGSLVDEPVIMPSAV